jgi:hypothetical protein
MKVSRSLRGVLHTLPKQSNVQQIFEEPTKMPNTAATSLIKATCMVEQPSTNPKGMKTAKSATKSTILELTFAAVSMTEEKATSFLDEEEIIARKNLKIARLNEEEQSKIQQIVLRRRSGATTFWLENSSYGEGGENEEDFKTISTHNSFNL